MDPGLQEITPLLTRSATTGYLFFPEADYDCAEVSRLSFGVLICGIYLYFKRITCVAFRRAQLFDVPHTRLFPVFIVDRRYRSCVVNNSTFSTFCTECVSGSYVKLAKCIGSIVDIV